ncbi:MAG: VIT domain-containing protein [Pseudomonadota bacterium]
MNRHTARPVVVVVALVICALALAQEDRPAGLFTTARQLPLVSQAIRARISGNEARVELTQIFANDGEELGQADYQLLLPEGAQVTGFGFYSDGRLVRAELKEKDEAKAAHHAAAAAGRSTALLTAERNIQSFSVFPLRAGEQKRIQVELSIPVEMEMGRFHLALPVDSFLGQAATPSTVLCEIETAARLAGFGVEGHKPQVLARSPQRVSLALSASTPLDLWWNEEMPPLMTRAAAVSLIEGEAEEGARHGVQIQVALYDGGEWRAPYTSLHLLIDGSPSLRRRGASLRTLIERVLDQSPVPVELHVVGERLLQNLDGENPDTLVRALQDQPWVATSASDLERAAQRLGCGLSEVRCALVTDPQLPDLAELARSELRTILLADAHEAAFFADQVPANAALFQTEGDAPAKLLQLADQITLPVLLVQGIRQAGRDLRLIGSPALQVAEGGLLRLHALLDELGPLTVRLDIEGHEIERHIAITTPEPGSDAAASVQRSVYGRLLASWMQTYRAEPDAALKQRIIQVSLRERIPTAFTSLHAVDPELSVAATLPGDPVLTVHGEPGLVEVVAWYPFGEKRRLVHDPELDTFTDRFLVPRGWSATFYRIEVFKHFDDGRVELAHAFYQIDERGPQASLLFEPEQGLLSVVTGDETPAVASVIIHGDDKKALTLSPVGQSWLVAIADLPAAFTVYVRDRAGNRSAFACRRQGDELEVQAVQQSLPEPTGKVLAVPARMHSVSGLSLDGDELVLTTDRGPRRFSNHGLNLRSLELSSQLASGRDEILLGTEGGDLLRLSCRDARCTARRIAGVDLHHAVTGLEPLGNGRVLVAVLGQGLYELRGQRLRRSALRVGSRFVTALARHDDTLFVGTAYTGLWQVRGRRAVRTRFAHKHVMGLWSTAHGLEVHSGFGRFVRDDRGRFNAVDSALDNVRRGAPDLSHALHHDGALYVAGLDSGLFRVDGQELTGVAPGLNPMQRRLNVLASHAGLLWLGSEGGLLAVDTRQDRVVRTVLDEVAVHDLVSTAQGLAVASARGLYLLKADDVLQRLDAQSALGSRSFMAVAEVEGQLYAGTKEGLFVVEDAGLDAITAAQGFGVNWVTSLRAHDGSLFIGTYDSGVHRYDGARVEPIAGLEAQWVPPQGLSIVDGTLWVGGLGMPAARVDAAGQVEHLSLPVRDVNAVIEHRGELLVLTSHGLARLGNGR